MTEASVTVSVRFAWWLRPYLAALGFFCAMHGTLPDWNKLERVVQRAVRVKVLR